MESPTILAAKISPAAQSVFVAWALSAVVLVGLIMLLGNIIGRGPLGVLIDDRGRYSLTHLQIVLWTLLVFSLISGVFWARLTGHQGDKALDFKIPDQLLIVVGITLGSTGVATAIKAGKDSNRLVRDSVATAKMTTSRFSQVFLLEQGEQADKVIDVTKFQNFVLTLILIVAYLFTVIAVVGKVTDISHLDHLPGFSQSMTILLGISHAGYLAGKLPNPPGTPAG